ncbi:hypothetical protein [Novosphingobium sp.]|uniref:hypothetical protein n=1 Tax=Novosphingobium sp. TaxID=1874826 RepID=UPI003B5169CA
MTVKPPGLGLYALEVDTKGAAADIRLNDIPVAIVGLPGGSGQAFIPVPDYIIRGTNRLAARVMAVPEHQPSAAKVVIRIARFDEGDGFFSNAGQELVRLDWNGTPGQAMLARDFQADFGPLQWSWGRCATWSTPAEALNDAAAFVRDLVKAYFAADADWIEHASSAKFADLALAFPSIPVAVQKAQIANAIRSDPPEPVPNLPPPQPVLCCERRLLMLLGSDGHPWLRKQRPGARGSGAQLKLGKIDRAWQLIR